MRLILTAMALLCGSTFILTAAAIADEGEGGALHISLVSDYVEGFGKVRIDLNSDDTITFTREKCGTYEESGGYCDHSNPKFEQEIIKTPITFRLIGQAGREVTFVKKPEYHISHAVRGERATFIYRTKTGPGGGEILKQSIRLFPELTE